MKLYVNKLPKLVDEYHNATHSLIKMKPVDVKLGKHIDFDFEVDRKKSKFNVGDHVRIS